MTTNTSDGGAGSGPPTKPGAILDAIATAWWVLRLTVDAIVHRSGQRR